MQELATTCRRLLHHLPPRSEVGGSDEGRRTMVVHSQVMIRNKAIGKMSMFVAAFVVCFVAVLALTGKAA